MKIEPRQVDAFLKKPDPRIRGVVVYGNDDGLVAERAAQLARTVCEDLKDPFRVVDIAGDALKADPARLADEFGAMSLMGGRRVIRVRPAGEESATAFQICMAAKLTAIRQHAAAAKVFHGAAPAHAGQPRGAGADRDGVEAAAAANPAVINDSTRRLNSGGAVCRAQARRTAAFRATSSGSKSSKPVIAC